MKTVIHQANSRGHADHGWLRSNHSFSFASYHNPERMGFGLLRVLNDDVVEPTRGFETHPHKNMEIVSIPLSGALRHKDSEGNRTVIQSGEVQLMSAGTGVLHSEFNDSDKEVVNFLQIWVLPEKLDIAPRYDQAEFPEDGRKNQLQLVVSPLDGDEKGIKINQQAYFSLLDLDKDHSLPYKLKNRNHGVYVFVLEGSVKVEDKNLEARDAIGINECSSFEISATKDSKLVFIEIPMSQ